MNCAVYRSTKKRDTYLYLLHKDDFSQVPEALLQALGTPVHVMDLELTPERQLARENTATVMHQLDERGWLLQMPTGVEHPH